MKNFIFGSGIIGYLAKYIFTDYVLIPFKRSRYFYFEIPWSDNFIKYDKNIDDFMKNFVINDSPMLIYKSPFSYNGQLFYNKTEDVVSDYLNKIYGDVPLFADRLLQTTFTIYPTSIKSIHDMLQYKLGEEIRKNIRLGELVNIDIKNKLFMLRDPKTGIISKHEYDKIISTIPLDALCKYCNLTLDIKSRNICYYVINADIDLEGAQQCYVVDNDILFFKVSNIGNHYLFWSTDIIDNPYNYFGKFLNYKIDIIEAHMIDNAMPVGDIPDLKLFEDYGIYCVGSNAQWDDNVDITSSIRRLLYFNLG